MHGKGVVRRLSLEAAFLPVIDDLPTFVLLISMVRRLLILLLFPLQCLSSLTAPSLWPSLTFSTLQLNYSVSPPFSPLPHSYAFVSLPKTPPVKSPFLSPPPPPHPRPMFQVSSIYCMASYQNFNIFGGPNWILLHAYIEWNRLLYIWF